MKRLAFSYTTSIKMSAYTPTQMTAIRAELLESHLRITGKNVALIKELKAQIEALELENEAHEDEIAWINDLQDPELAWIADPESEPEIQARHEAILGENLESCWHCGEEFEKEKLVHPSVIGDLICFECHVKDKAEAEAEAKAEAEAREYIQCFKCQTDYVRDGRDHDDFIFNSEGEKGLCLHCYNGEYDSDKEEEEDDEEEEGVCNCVEDYEAYQNGAEFQEIERQREVIRRFKAGMAERGEDCWECGGTETLDGWITYKEGGERHCGYCCDEDGNPYFTCGKCEWSLFIEKHMKLDGKEHEFQFDLCRACYAQEHDELLECADCDCKGDPIHFNRGHKGYYCDDCLTPELAKMM